MNRIVAAVLAVLGLQAVAVVVFVYSGLYNVAATVQHYWFEYAIIEVALNQSLKRHARSVDPPPDLADPALLRLGFDKYLDNCVQCHGGPGVPPSVFAMGMRPVPPPLVQVARERSVAELFWVVKNGIKMTGMPGWQFKMDDREMWAVVALVARFPTIHPARFRERVAARATAQAAGSKAAGSRHAGREPAAP